MKRICLAVLDWGLGHATRSMPIIRALVQADASVYLASSGAAGDLLQRTFPDLPFLPLPSYAVRYHSGHRQRWQLAKQIPRLLGVIRAEQQTLKAFHRQYVFDAVISDHRYGAYLPGIANVMIAHQLAIPVGSLTPALYTFHKQWLAPFDEIWVPDYPGHHNLAGDLAHTNPLPHRLHYIGPLSQFDGQPPLELENGQDIVAVLSGPEPQHSQLAAILKRQLLALERPATLILGKPDLLTPNADQQGLLKMLSYALTLDLRQAFQRASCVISRSGYTSVMDFACLRLGRTLLIPTPGQPEQEYLARYHAESGRAMRRAQGALNLAQDLTEAAKLTGWQFPGQSQAYVARIEAWLESI